MDSGANIANLALAASTGVLTLLALAAARTRSTPVGRSHLALLLIFVLASLVHLAAGRSPIDSELAQRVSKVAFVGVSALVLRIDSPGGSGTASDIIWQEVVRARGARQARDHLRVFLDIRNKECYLFCFSCFGWSNSSILYKS